jgi:hypothetical protein
VEPPRKFSQVFSLQVNFSFGGYTPVVILRLLIPVLLLAPAASAQLSVLGGRVTDESGAAVPGAKVLLQGPNGMKKTVSSGADGRYSFSGLTAGDYTLAASATDFSMLPVKISLQGGTQSVDLRLKIAVAAQQVTVEADTGPKVTVEAANNASALVIKGDDLAALSDDPDDLLADLQALAGPSAGPSGGSMFVDGFSGGELPPKESIREIRINQNPFSPEYDKLGLGRIEIFTKPGSEKFHGRIAYNFADSIWNSRNPYAAQKAPLQLNESENSVSGPLNKRSSFTLDLERHAVDNGAIINAVLLTGPFTAVSKTPQRRFRISPRMDYQLNQNNTFSLRYTYTGSEIQDFGIGGFNLVSRGYDAKNTYNTVQATETAIAGTTVNELRFQYFRQANRHIPNNNDPEIQVQGAFTGGGAQTGTSTDVQNNYELQNYTSVLRGAHSWRFGVRMREGLETNVSEQNFGGTFTFNSIESYQLTLAGIQEGLPPAQIRAMGGGASQFTISAGTPAISVRQFDAGIFGGDDWRLRPNLTLSLGLRYETQSNIHDHTDFAPRVGFAWAVDGHANKPAKTILRGGFGMFYDRFALSNTLTADRFNGLLQQQYVVTNPDFYPVVPAIGALAGNQSPQVIQEISSHLRAPYLMQSLMSVERQLPRNTTIAMTYTNSHALHVLRSEDINVPLPGTGIYPYGNSRQIFEMTSSGLYNQNQLITNVNSRLNGQVSMFASYVLNRAMSNTDGLGTFPANPYNFSGEYGPAATDIRQRFLIGGSINTKWGVRMSPYVILQSGAPFDITTGTDVYGTTLFNARPGLALNANAPGVVSTPYGLLDSNPTPLEKILPRNDGRGPGQFTVNVRIAKAIGFGPEKQSSKPPAAQGGLAAGANPTAPGGMRGLLSPPSTNRRYNLSIGLSARNLLNHDNPGPIIGNIMSPLFGRANQIAGASNGEGFSENANNRRLELQMRFSF